MPNKERQSYVPLIFDQFPELLIEPPRYGIDAKGNAYLEWRATRLDGHGTICLVLHAFMPSAITWSYAIYDPGTNTVRHYVGRHGDPTKDPVIRLEEGRH